MFGYTIVKKKDLRQLGEKVDDLIQHVGNNAGFVDENGNFNRDSRNINIMNETRLKNWTTFFMLIHEITTVFKQLTR